MTSDVAASGSIDLLSQSVPYRIGHRLRDQLRVVPLHRAAARQQPVWSFTAGGLEGGLYQPSAAANGTNELHPYFGADGRSLPIFGIPNPPPWIDPALDIPIPTPFVALPRMLEAECREHNGFSYLAVIVNGDPDDARIDNIGGDLTPDWGSVRSST